MITSVETAKVDFYQEVLLLDRPPCLLPRRQLGLLHFCFTARLQISPLIPYFQPPQGSGEDSTAKPRTTKKRTNRRGILKKAERNNCCGRDVHCVRVLTLTLCFGGVFIRLTGVSVVALVVGVASLKRSLCLAASSAF